MASLPSHILFGKQYIKHHRKLPSAEVQGRLWYNATIIYKLSDLPTGRHCHRGTQQPGHFKALEMRTILSDAFLVAGEY